MKSKPTKSSKSFPSPERDREDGYPTFQELIQRNVANISRDKPLFYTAEYGKLWDTFFVSLPPIHRQHYNCSSCRHFINAYGSLVHVNVDGSLESPIWEPGYFEGICPSFFADAMISLSTQVEQSTIEEAFINYESTWGDPKTGAWTHLHGISTLPLTARDTVGARSGEVCQNVGMLNKAVQTYGVDTINKAIIYLKAGDLSRPEKALPIAEWFLEVKEAFDIVKKRHVHSPSNILWRYAALAPTGFCHLRSGMLGTLMDSIDNEESRETMRRKWDEKMDGLNYQRPKAAPKEGAILQAEKLVEELRSAGAFERRFAKISDILPTGILWKSAPKKGESLSTAETKGVFGHLSPKKKTKEVLDLPAKKMSWVVFQRDVLPSALKIKYFVPAGSLSFYGMMVASNPKAPPIFQWDGREGKPRNTACCYVYDEMRPSHYWNLQTGSWTKVKVICKNPWHWQDDLCTNFGQGVLFVLKDCYDRNEKGDLALFPECFRSEYHGMRKVIEAFSKAGKPTGREAKRAANGYWLAKSDKNVTDLKLAVTTLEHGHLCNTQITIDRWE